MSWDSYLDNIVAQCKDASGSGHCDKAVMIGLDGGAQWTTNGHPNAFKVTPDEAASIARAMKSKDYSTFMSNGIYVEGVKYQFLRADESVIFGKKKEHGAITIQASKTCVIIGHCPEGGQQGCLNKGVNVVSEYLASMNM